MVFYPSILDLFNPSAQSVTGLLMHMLTLLVCIGLSFYGLMGVVKYTSRISKNWHLIGIAFALMTFIPIGDMFEHLVIYPGTEFWHHMHIFASVAAFYFIYRFVMLMDADNAESTRKSFLILAAIAVIAVGFAWAEMAFEDTIRIIYLLVYGLLTASTLVLAFALYRILGKLGKLETAFSLKSFIISMIPIISTSLFLVTVGSILAEFIKDSLPTLVDASAVLVLIAAVNIFYIILAMALTGFAYMSGKINSFYSPIGSFLKSKGMKGQISPVASGMGKGSPKRAAGKNRK